MPNLQIQRYESEIVVGDPEDASAWIGDVLWSLGDIMSQCKEWWDDPEKERWCVKARSDAHAAISALAKLQGTIKSQPQAHDT